MASAIERKHISRKLGTFSGLMYVSMCVCVSVDVFTGAFANDSNLLHRILCVVFIAYQECDLPSGLFGEALEHAKQEWQPKGGGGGHCIANTKAIANRKPNALLALALSLALSLSQLVQYCHAAQAKFLGLMRAASL